MSYHVEYDLEVRISGTAPGPPRGRTVAMRVERVVKDALARDGFEVRVTPGNAIPEACVVEVTRIEQIEHDEESP